MIPLIYFLLAWLVFLLIYLLLSLISLMQVLRFGLKGTGTMVIATLFILGVGAAVLGSGGYFLTVNWNTSVDLFSGLSSSPYLNP